MSAPAFDTLLWTGWSAPPAVIAEAAIGAGLYLGAVRRVRAPWPVRRTLSFLGGIAVIVIALASGIDAQDDVLLSDHMIQHLLLVEAAPLLLLAGRPGLLALRAAPGGARQRLLLALDRLRPATQPLSCLVIFSVIVLATHLPGFYDATLAHPWLHDIEHALYIVAGLFMWWPVLDADPLARHRLNGLSRLAYVIAAMMPMSLLGAFLSRDVHLMYAPYALVDRLVGISPIRDQQLGGTLMWVVGSMLMVAAGLWQAMAAMVDEERRMQVRERHSDEVANIGLGGGA